MKLGFKPKFATHLALLVLRQQSQRHEESPPRLSSTYQIGRLGILKPHCVGLCTGVYILSDMTREVL